MAAREASPRSEGNTVYPTLFHFGHLVIPTFAPLLIGGLLLAQWMAQRTAPWCGLPGEALWDAGVVAVVAAFVASRLLLIAGNPRGFAMAPLLLLMQPSLTWGGLLLAVLGTGWIVWRRGLAVLAVADAWAAPAALLWAAVALGQLLGGLDPGMPVARWGLRTSLAGYREVPVALYAAGVALGTAGLLFFRVRRPHRPGSVAAVALVLGGVAEFFLGFWRLPYLYDGGTPLALLDPLQWKSLALACTGAVLAVVMSGPAGQGERESRVRGRQTQGPMTRAAAVVEER